MRPCPLLLLIALAAAQDVDLPAPERLTAHPDGARLEWHLDLPAGTHRIRLPARLPGVPAVVAGVTAWKRVAIAGAPLGEPPAVLADLRQRRDRLAAALLRIADRRQLTERWAEEWRARTPALATAPAAWQAALDEHLARLERSDQEAASSAIERTALINAVAAATGDGDGAEALLGLGGQDLASRPVWPQDALTLRWSGRTVPSAEALEVVLAVPAAVRVAAESPAGGWTASTSATLDGAVLHLVRHAVLRKPAGEDWGTPRVRITTAPLVRPLAPPAPRPVAVAEDQAVKRRTAVQTSGSAGWGVVARSAGSAGEAQAKMSAATPSVEALAEEPAPVAGPLDDRDPFAADLAAIALPAGSAQVTVSLPSSDLQVLADEWILAPQLSPVALRRVSLRLDGAALPGGPCTIADGLGGLRNGSLPDLAPGATCDLVVAEDDSVFVGEIATWQADPATQTSTSQRHGADRWVWNTGPAPRRLRVYLTTPVSRAKDIVVGLDPASTPGYALIQPGVLSWQLDFSPAFPTRVGLGWTLQASGGAKL